MRERSARRKWGATESPEFKTFSPTKSSTKTSTTRDNQAMEHPTPTSATVKQLEYIRMLEERNRLKSKLQQQATQASMKEREQAFSTNFNGANRDRAPIKTSRVGKSKSQTRLKKESKSTRNVRSAPLRRTRQAKDTSRRQWDKGEVQFAVGKQGRLQAQDVPEVKNEEEDEIERDVIEEDIKGGEDDDDEDQYMDESFEDFDDDDIEEIPVKELAVSTEKCNYISEDSDLDSPQNLSAVHPFVPSTSADTPLRSSIVKLMAAACPESAEKLRESLQRIYCDETDNTMQFMSDEDAPTTVSSKQTNKKATTMKKTSVSHSAYQEKEVKQAKDDDEVARSIRNAIAEENARARTHSTERKPSRQQPLAEAKTSSSEQQSSTTDNIYSILKDLSDTKQSKLLSILSQFAASSQREEDVDRLRRSCGADDELWHQLQSAVEFMQKSPSGSQKTVQQVEEHVRQQTLYLDQLKQQQREEEERLKLVEQRRKERLKELELEELEHERRLEARRKERLERLRREEEKEEELLLERRRKRLQELEELEKKQTEALYASTPVAEAKTASSEEDSNAKQEQVGKDIAPELNSEECQRAIVENAADAKAEDGDEIEYGVEIRVKLLSSWGETRSVGLTQIEVFDAHDNRIEIPLGSVELLSGLNCSKVSSTASMAQNLPRLFDGITTTKNEKEMWVGRRAEIGGALHIVFHSLKGITPQYLKIWNYQKRNKACSKCVRDVEIFVNDKCCFSGSLKETLDAKDAHNNGCTIIPINKAKEPQEAKVAIPPTKAHEPCWLASTSSQVPTKARSKRQSKALDEEHFMQVKDEESSITTTAPVLSARAPKITIEKPIESELKKKDRHNSIQASWDSLDFFSRSQNNRSRISRSSQNEITLRSSMEKMEGMLDKRHENIAMQDNDPYASMNDDELMATLIRETNEMLAVDSPGAEANTEDTVMFPIPELPKGQVLQIYILSTWGDPYYVGLNGIDLFDDQGQVVNFEHHVKSITADPKDINVLDEYENDPRRVQNLLDGVDCTCDDLHCWLAPFEKGRDHVITIEFDSPLRLSMLRIWNYNKSRTHSYRGVRNARILLDDVRIFEGEVRKANGTITSVEKCAEVILFTMDQVLLELIDSSDALNQSFITHGDDTSSLVTKALKNMERYRPRTSDGSSKGKHLVRKHQAKHEEHETYEQMKDAYEQQIEHRGADGRPMTAVKVTPHLAPAKLRPKPESRMESVPEDIEERLEVSEEAISSGLPAKDAVDLPQGRTLSIRLRQTWGDLHYVGLGGLEVLVGVNGSIFSLTMRNLSATPRDLSSLGNIGDPRTLDKLIDGTNVTTDDTHMWLIPFTKGKRHEIQVELGRDQYVYGLRIWNYNKSREDSYRGVKRIDIYLDGVEISPRGGFSIRKAPGDCSYSYGQLVPFATPGTENFTRIENQLKYPFKTTANYISPVLSQDYEAPLFPQGFVLKMVFLSTWGDPYYIGLNGLEIYGYNGKKLNIEPAEIQAEPSSLRDLDPKNCDDARVPENLLNGVNNNWEAHDAWLAPLASSFYGHEQTNTVQIVFNQPIVISMIKFWNYSKTPERGVREFQLWLDDYQIFCGGLRQAPERPQRGRSGKLEVFEDFSQPILFSNSMSLASKEKEKIEYCGRQSQDVLAINEGQVMEKSRAMSRAPDPSAIGVQIDLEKRPMTAVVPPK